jgi:methionyl-tRNA formyltransferase
MIKKSVSLSEEPPGTVSVVVTAIAPDRPGIVRLLAERARGFGANWAGSRMASLAGQFAGMVHFEVPIENADRLVDALRGLESSGISVVLARSEAPSAPAGRRIVHLELLAPDRPGIVRELSTGLAELRISIHELQTEIVAGSNPTENKFKVEAMLMVPESLSNEQLRKSLDVLATEGIVDIALDRR